LCCILIQHIFAKIKKKAKFTFLFMDDVAQYITTLSTGKKIEDKESDWLTASFMLLVYIIVGIFLYKN